MPVDKTRSDYDAIKPKWRRLRDCYNYRKRGSFYNAVSAHSRQG
jgi:hypothetical protein